MGKQSAIKATNSAAIKSGGFTLVEFMMVLILASVVVGASLSLFDQYRKQQDIEDNLSAVARLNGAIQSYFLKYGHYPCPAPLTALPGDVQFGSATDCTDTSPGDYIRASRNMDTDFDSIPDTIRTIRWGTIPFRTLTINQPPTGRIVRFSESDSYDPYKRRYSYIVTEQQATLSYQEGAGALHVVDEHGKDISDGEDFVIISHGPNGVGAYSTGGQIEVPCASATGIDEENCNGDHKFIQAPLYLSEGSDNFDDSLTFMTWIPFYLWQQSDTNPMDIHNKNTGNVGVGTKAPEAKLHIKNGNFTSFYWSDWADENTKEGKVATENLCTQDASRCFPPALVGTGSTAACGSGRFAHGIKYASAACEDFNPASVTHGCGTDSYINKMVYDIPTQTMSFECLNPRL